MARRRFLVGLGALAAGTLAAGCTGDDDASTRPPGAATASAAAPTTVDPDASLVTTVRRDEGRIVAAYRGVLRQQPQLRPDLDVLQAHHETHIDVLGGRTAGIPASAPAGSARAAVADLMRLEQQAVAARRDDALAARSGELARVLAAMAASSAQHAVVLDNLSTTARRGPS